MHILPYAILLLSASRAFSQAMVVFDHPAPCLQISGLASDCDRLWILDPQTEEILGLDYMSGSIEIVLPCGTADPYRLACADSVLYFAGSGTAVLHAISVEGDSLGQFDLSSLGIGEITGIGSENQPGPDDFLWIADSSQMKCFKIGPLMEFDQNLAELDVSPAPGLSDITNGPWSWYDDYCWICSGGGDQQLQLWSPSGLYWNLDFSYSGIEMVSLVTEFSCYSPAEFLCVYDPSASTIYGIYFGMGLDQGTWGSIKALFQAAAMHSLR